jgi:hypothetical protein
MSKLHRDDGQPLDATFSVEENDSVISIVYESRGGRRSSADARKAEARNVDYSEGLELILQRLRVLKIEITAALVESRTSVDLPVDERRIRLDGRNYPVDIDDPGVLRRQLGAAMAKVARAPGARRGGNRTKRIRLELGISKGRCEPAILEQYLASGRGPGRLSPAGLQAARTLTTDDFTPEELEVLTRAGTRGAEPVTSGSQSASAVAMAEPERSRVQGYEPDVAIRRAIERWAMLRAEKHYREQGFDVEDTAATEPYDLRCAREGLEVRVEVKGTRGDGAEIEVTRGEVLNARGDDWRTDLFVVSRIEVERTAEGPVARGGMDRPIEGWRPTDGDLTPIRFRCVVPEKRG